MPSPKTPLTDREKAALLAYKFGLIDTTKAAYIAADDQPQAHIKGLSALNTLVSRWINSEKVKGFLSHCDSLILSKQAEAFQRGKDQAQRASLEAEKIQGDSERTQTRQAREIDYYDPKNQRTQINRIIAESQDDPKTQLDAIKAIQQTQRDDRQAAKDNQIQRFYTPVNCHFCPLYLKKRQK